MKIDFNLTLSKLLAFLILAVGSYSGLVNGNVDILTNAIVVSAALMGIKTGAQTYSDVKTSITAIQSAIATTQAALDRQKGLNV